MRSSTKDPGAIGQAILRFRAPWEKVESMRWIVGADEHDPIIEILEEELRAEGHEVVRVGARPHRPEAWGDVAVDIGRRVASGEADRGIVCCYTGTGVTMAANKVSGIRA